MQISDAEWDVMDVVWKLGPCAASDVIAQLRDSHEWNHRTIRTLLARLVEKGALRYQVDSKRYIYRASVSREQCQRRESRSFLNKVFGGDVEQLLVHFLSSRSLSADELDRLRKLLDDRASNGRSRK